MIRKRLLSACLALALCLSLLPATALAAEDAPGTLWVGQTQITTSGYWKTTTEGNLITSSENDYNVYYDGNGTLTLNGATIQGGTSTGSVPYGAGIYAQCNSGESVSLTIELIDENTITGYYGIYVNAEISADSYGTDASLTITGESNGSLKVSGSYHGIYVKSGTGGASLNINDASVVASSSSSHFSYAGVYVQSSAHATSSPQLSLKVNGGSLTASGSASGEGIKFYVGAFEATSATTSLTVTDNAIVDAKNGGISAKQISNPINTDISATSSNGGIVFDGTEGTVYGDVTLQEDLEIGEGESLTIPDGSSLNCNDKLTNSGTILASGGTVTGSLSGGTEVTTPSITAQPTGKTVTEGSAVEFSITASDAQTYQWQQSTDSGSSWTAINDATGDSYTISSTTSSMNNYQYRCVVKSASGVSVISNAATLTVETYTPPTTYTIRADVTPAGSGSVSGGGSYTEGTSVTLTATNNPGYRFVGWVDQSGQSVSSDNPFTFVATSDSTLTAKFEQVYTVTVNVSGNGTATADKNTAAEGKTVTLTATPDSGYRFTGWTSSDGVTFANASSESTTFTMPAGDVTVTAGFTRISPGSTTYAITAPDVENGTVRVSPSRASRGTTVTITVTPDEGYELESLTVLDSRDNEITLTDKGDGKYTFTMPSGRVTVEASFAEIAPEPLPFGDVDDGDWFADAVRFVYENGMMNGVSETSFVPHATTSRSMIVTILYRLEGEPVVDYAMDFTDVAGDAYYAEAVRWAASEGIVGGYGGGLFGSDDAVTREQLAVILYRYAVYKGYDVSIGEDTNILSYADFADLSEYAIPSMQWACGAGVITGVTDATLVPQGEATRAQVAAMLMRFLEANS